LEEKEMPRNRRIARRDKPPARIRALNGERVFPIRYTGRVNGHYFNMMTGSLGKDGDIVKNSVGEPMPYQSIGQLVWK
jgi:hypothetical protein